MNGGLLATLAISASTIASLTAAACDHGTQARIIRTYRRVTSRRVERAESVLTANPEVDDKKIPS